MAYNGRNLSVFGYANGATMWHYRTNDAAVDVLAPGYFNAGADMFRAGDFIMATIGGSGAMLHVDAKDGSSIKVSPLLAAPAIRDDYRLNDGGRPITPGMAA